VRLDKTARLLCPGGWLALLSTGERYDDPFRAKLLEMWVERATDGGAWVKQQKLSGTEIVAGTGLFDVPLERASVESIVLPVEVVIGVETTRATYLTWPEEARRAFTDELRDHLAVQTEVGLKQEGMLTMARRLPPA
jgi:hypothetical protein